jgi:hypothetical protein
MVHPSGVSDSAHFTLPDPRRSGFMGYSEVLLQEKCKAITPAINNRINTTFAGDELSLNNFMGLPLTVKKVICIICPATEGCFLLLSDALFFLVSKGSENLYFRDLAKKIDQPE